MELRNVHFFLTALLLMPVSQACSGYYPATTGESVAAAELVVIAETVEKFVQDASRPTHTALVKIKCVLKGPAQPLYLNVSDTGDNGGWCFTTTFLEKQNIIAFLKVSLDPFGSSSTIVPVAQDRPTGEVKPQTWASFCGLNHKATFPQDETGTDITCPAISRIDCPTTPPPTPPPKKTKKPSKGVMTLPPANTKKPNKAPLTLPPVVNPTSGPSTSQKPTVSSTVAPTSVTTLHGTTLEPTAQPATGRTPEPTAQPATGDTYSGATSFARTTDYFTLLTLTALCLSSYLGLC